MELTNRQLFIISYLLNHPQGISSEHLAEQVGVSVRTLQSEVQNINSLPDSDLSIDANSKLGYVVRGATQADRDRLLRLAADRQSLYMPEERVNDILTVLLFARGYVNMETVAGTLYLSKASVYRTVESNYAIRSMVTISRTRGLIIDRPESGMRQILTKVFDKDAQNPIAQELKQDYIDLDSRLRPILVDLFTAHRYSVSGEGLRTFRRYLIITVLRDAMGFPLEETAHGLPVSRLMLDVAKALQGQLGVTLSPSEMQDCQARLNSLCTFLWDIPEHRMDWQDTWEPRYRLFEQTLHDRYGVELCMDAEEKQRFLLHIHKLHQRVLYGQNESNYHKREINRSYPLCVHLVVLEFERCFGFPVPETEFAYLAMYIAVRLRKHFGRIDCIIVTAKNPSVAWPMKQWMEEHFSRHLRSVEIIAHYRFDPAKVRDDMLVLTTGEAVVLACPQAILVKPFGLEEDYDLIDTYIQGIRDYYRETFFQSAMERLCSGLEIMEVRKKSLYDILEGFGIHWTPGGQYEFVTDTDAFLIPQVHEGTGENRIRILYLPQPVFHRGTNLRYLVLSDYYLDSKNMLDFYSCLQNLLRPGNLDNIRPRK